MMVIGERQYATEGTEQTKYVTCNKHTSLTVHQTN